MRGLEWEMKSKAELGRTPVVQGRAVEEKPSQETAACVRVRGRTQTLQEWCLESGTGVSRGERWSIVPEGEGYN